MKLGSRHVWIALQLIAGAAFLIVSAKLTRELFCYVAYCHHAEGHIKEWKILEVSPGHFKISVNYEFEVEGDRFGNQHLFDEPRFHNRYAAEETMRQWTHRPWTVWFRSTNPPKSTLVRAFPLKGTVHLTLVFGVFFYFRWLRGYLSKRGVYTDRGPTKLFGREKKHIS